MSTTFDAVTMPAPYETPDHAVDVTIQRRMADGTLKTEVIVQKLAWALAWRNLTAAQVATLRGIYETAATQTFSPHDTASTYSVHVMAGTWSRRRDVIVGGAWRYVLSFDVIEV